MSENGEGTNPELELPQEYPLTWQIIDTDGSVVDSGEGIASVASGRLGIRSAQSLPFDLSVADIGHIEQGDHVLRLMMDDGTACILSRVGRLHDALTAELMQQWLAKRKKETLVKEKQLAEFRGVEAACSGSLTMSGSCCVTVYETGLSLLWNNGEANRIPYPFTGYPKDDDWQFVFSLPANEQWVIGKFGRDTDTFRQILQKAVNDLQQDALEFVRSLDKSLSPLKARTLAPLFIDGKAVSRTAIISSAPGVWKGLENHVEKAGLAQSMRKLLEISGAENVRVGVKRGLKGGEQAEYTWFFVPVYINGTGSIVMEASAEDGTGRATYVFKVDSCSDAAAFAVQAELAMDALNYALYMVNFRREPIYLKEEALNQPKYQHYAKAIRRIPALGYLRARFAGKVAHSDEGAWESGIRRLIGE